MTSEFTVHLHYRDSDWNIPERIVPGKMPVGIKGRIALEKILGVEAVKLGTRLNEKCQQRKLPVCRNVFFPPCCEGCCECNYWSCAFVDLFTGYDRSFDTTREMTLLEVQALIVHLEILRTDFFKLIETARTWSQSLTERRLTIGGPIGGPIQLPPKEIVLDRKLMLETKTNGAEV